MEWKETQNKVEIEKSIHMGDNSALIYLCIPIGKFLYPLDTQLSLLQNEESTVGSFLQSLLCLRFCNPGVPIPFFKAVLPIWQQPRCGNLLSRHFQWTRIVLSHFNTVKINSNIHIALTNHFPSFLKKKKKTLNQKNTKQFQLVVSFDMQLLHNY